MAHRRTASQRRLDNFSFPNNARPSASASRTAMFPIPSRSPSPPPSPPFPVSVLSASKGATPAGFLDSLATGKPARHWQQRRTTALALVALLGLCAYVLLLSPLSLAALAPIALQSSQQHQPPVHAEPSAPWRLAAHKKLDWKKLAQAHAAADARPQLALDTPHALAALSSFLAALPENHLPSSVDPRAPLDPSLVLDFDTRGDRAGEELEEVVRDVWTRNPVILYGKVRFPPPRCQ
jgi:hypothetical protein